MEKYIPWIISALALLISYLTFVRNGNKDSKQEMASESLRFDGLKESILKVSLKLDQVFTTTSETRTDVKNLAKDVENIRERVIVCERDLKTAFSRIDELKGEMNNEKD